MAVIITARQCLRGALGVNLGFDEFVRAGPMIVTAETGPIVQFEAEVSIGIIGICFVAIGN